MKSSGALNFQPTNREWATSLLPFPLGRKKMVMTIDMTYPFLGFWDYPSTCRIRVFKEDDRRVVIATELPDNPGTSITNAAEMIATELWRRVGRLCEYTWIEHYPERGE